MVKSDYWRFNRLLAEKLPSNARGIIHICRKKANKNSRAAAALQSPGLPAKNW